jgi:tricorn protease
MTKFTISLLFFGLLIHSIACAGREAIELAAVPSLSPNGDRMVFVWRGDLWLASVEGGNAKQLTRHPAADHWPSWSPDGNEIAFSSKRNGYWNLYRISPQGGEPTQLTNHSEGYLPLEWFPDGKSLLAQAVRDHGGFEPERLLKVDARGQNPDKVIFDAYARGGTVSPDGKKILFIREGKNLLYRKGYSGPKASQIWVYDLNSKKFELILHENTGNRSPMWKADGSGFYYLSAASGSFNLWERNMDDAKGNQLTFFEDDSIIIPRISRDGKTIVFRHQFDFYSFHPSSPQKPKKIELWCQTDAERKSGRRRWYDSTWNNEASQGLAWTSDYLEMAFTAGGDLWVMDTVLREPQRVCGSTASHETEVVFDEKDEELFFLRDFGDHVGIWKATRGNPDDYWFKNNKFKIEPFANDSSNKAFIKLSPDGTRLAYVKGRGELVVTPLEKNEPVTLLVSDVRPWYEWSPDGKWMVAQAKDSNDNWDIWIIAADGSQEPYNLSRHPGWDGGPRWSPDGKKIAFVGQRGREDDMDLFYVYLSDEYEERSERITKMREAESLLRSSRKPPVVPIKETEKLDESTEEKWKPPSFRVDFEDLYTRVRRISLPDSRETEPFWHSSSQKLGFRSNYKGDYGTYNVLFPRDFSPRLITKTTGKFPIWNANELYWMVDNLPSRMRGNTLKKYTFKSYQDTDRQEYMKLSFRIIWRNLRDYFYDEKMNGKDWNSVLAKYEKHITPNMNLSGYGRLVAMLFGELNSSHLFFNSNEKNWPSWSTDNAWRMETLHLGLRFEINRKGAGLKIKDILSGGPCDHPEIGISKGNHLIAVNGNQITPKDRLVDILNGRLSEAMELTFKTDSEEKSLSIQPINYATARRLLKNDWIKNNRNKVSQITGGKMGYLHVDKMRWDDLEKFEADIFSEGYGKHGLVIDVRNNTGGFTADRMLYALRRFKHAFTIPRGGHISYPLGYLDHPFWDKPIVVLCNQNTSSNGEIFCHAIKSLKLGKLVGTPTSGSVISIYSNEKILDLGDMSVPFRGWYVLPTKKNMEGNGAQPDLLVWPKPGDIPQGRDAQLKVGAELLLKNFKK